MSMVNRVLQSIRGIKEETENVFLGLMPTDDEILDSLREEAPLDSAGMLPQEPEVPSPTQAIKPTSLVEDQEKAAQAQAQQQGAEELPPIGQSGMDLGVLTSGGSALDALLANSPIG